MLSVLCSGTLIADPKERKSAAGKTYATGTMRVPAEDADAVLVSLIAFSTSAVDALLGLTKGDNLAITGRGKLAAWEKDGEQRHGLSVVADHVMTIYEAGKRRKRATGTDDEQAEQ